MSIDLTAALGRPSRPAPIGRALAELAGKTVLITGANGSIGRALADTLEQHGIDVTRTDIEDLDVRWPETVRGPLALTRPDVIFHLAGDKHAPHGEEDAHSVALTNVDGTWNVLNYAGDARVVVASTCKACDPETVYGASKLICERMALQAGQSVARFYNVVETQGNVFELWADQVASLGHILLMDARRYFISLDEAVALLIQTAVMPAGRYTTTPGMSHWMSEVAARCFPGVPVVNVDRRRGDRKEEPLLAASEKWLVYPLTPIREIVSYHDTPKAANAVRMAA